MTARLLAEVPALLEAHGRFVLATVVAAVGSTPRAAGARLAVLPDGTQRDTIGGGKFESLVVADARRLLDAGGLPVSREYVFTPEGADSFGAICGGRMTVLLEILEKPARLLVVGAGHCGRALANVAAAAGFDVTVADERPEQLDPDAFPKGVRLVGVREDYADLPLPEPRGHVALVSRGHVTDGLALRRLRGAPCAYLGMMGSNAKKKALFDELRREGWSEEELGRVVTPIGLDIAAETPEEIAVAIVAQVVARRRRGA